MLDLDEDLLALAAGDDVDDEKLVSTNTRSKGNSGGLKRKRVLNEDGNEDEDDYNPGGEYYSENDSGINSEDQEEETSPYPLEGKYKDEEDRAKIESMPEMDRETLLFDRLQQVQKYEERMVLRERARNIRAQKQRQMQKDNVKVRSSSRSTRTTGYTEVRDLKLLELKKQRARKSGNHKYDGVEGDSDNYKDKSDDYSDAGDKEDDYDPYYDRKSRYSDDENVKWAEEDQDREASLEEFNKVKIGRSFVAKFCFYPEFNEHVQGCYGRVNIDVDKHSGQPIYRMVKVEKVFLQKPYNMGKFFTNQYFGVTQGKDRKVFQMNFFSDGLITQPEYERYMNQLSKHDINKPSIYSLDNKAKDLINFASQPMTPKLTDQLVRNRLQFNKKLTGTNAVLEKTVLKDKLQYAKETNNEQNVVKYSSQLKNLEKRIFSYEKHHENDQAGIKKLGALTSKNRRLNMDKIKHVETSRKEEVVNQDVKNDPFSRLKTRTKIYYQEIQKKENEKAMELAKQKQFETDMESLVKKEQRMLAKFRRLGGLEEIIRGLSFRIDIDA